MTNRTLRAMTLTGVTASPSNGDTLENLSSQSAHIIINITALTGTTPTATFTVQGYDESSNTYYTMLVSTALNATGQTILKIGPSVTAAANLALNDFIPKFFRVVCVLGGTTPNITATVGVNLMG